MKYPEVDRLHSLPDLIAPLIANTQNDLTEIYMSWPTLQDHDVRLATFAKCLNALVPIHLSLYFLSDQMLDAKWWSSRNVPFYRPEGLAVILKEFENSQKTQLVLSIFQAYESSFRCLLTAIDQSSRLDHHSAFKSVYDRLFGLTLAPHHNDAVVTFDLLRNIRNTVHNNTVFFDKRAQDRSIVWNSETFHFKHGYPITFLNWDLLIQLVDECRAAAKSVITSDQVALMPTIIEDPYSREPIDEPV
ncbi:MAG TPA: hypothetical protein VD835_10840 [Pyrinomonadaceae bacterium]|nr:hypothetical protein [Pyrinomonadaceae bacterium]